MSSTDPITVSAYLAELRLAVHPGRRSRLLDEVRDHLSDHVNDLVGQGVPLRQAECEAVRRAGRIADVALRLREEFAIARARNDVLVAGEEDGLAPTHEAHDDSAVDSLRQQQRGRGVACVVEAGMPHARLLQQRSPVAVVAARVGGGPVWLWEEEVLVGPGGSGLEALDGLGSTVLAELGEHLGWDG